MGKKIIQQAFRPVVLCSIAAILLSLAGNAQAGNRGETYTDYARVVHVEPVWRIETIRQPQRVCNSYNSNSRPHFRPYQHGGGRHSIRPTRHGNQHNQQRRHSGSTIVGAVIGGAIGHHVGRAASSHGKIAGTIVGAAVGASIATSHNRHSQRSHNGRYNSHTTNRQQHLHGNAQHCSTTTHQREERRADGYNVTYVYRGNRFQTHTYQRPGKKIPVQVTISVAKH